mmetsp:Transcript_85918/g.152199  ORF Transcript_85918/g.152199 Transcript_85918/m.152199 type:complete len:179 (-) Transcript_85918:4-540(-)
MSTSSERISNMYANSATWSSKDAETKGRAAIHEGQVRRYSAANSRAFASSTVSQEDLEAERAAALKRKQQQDSEMSGFAEAQSQQATPKVTAGLFAAKPAKEAPKAARLPGFLAVKKQKTEESKAEETSPGKSQEKSSGDANAIVQEEGAQAETKASASGLGGLGAYGSESSEEEEDD